MSLTTTAPLVLPSGRHHSISHTDYTSPTTMQGQGQGPGPGAYYSRPLSSHGGGSSQGVAHLASPERAHSSHGFTKSLPGTTPQTPSYGQEIPQPPSSSHGYPATPLTGTGPYTSDSAGYYGISQTTELDPNMPSPPGTSDGRAPNFTPDGNPIVPVGISGGKMFQCRGYGECDKVFTRSEHLARHVRKHTGERPFPCHCGKAFSRLDNLRQHAATVHSDQSPLNDAMLNSLSPVHAALSANATKEQRKRGEIVQVPKNAVERPRQAETFRSTKGASPTTPYPAYPDGHTWDQQTRPRTGGTAYDYAFHSVDAVIDSAGPSRRPDSESEYGHFYDGPSKPPAPIPPPEPLNQVQFPYRPVSNGSIQHYAESEPPNSAHGPPESPMYTAPPVPQPNWSSPPPHTSYGASQDHRTVYHPTATPEGYRYPDAAQYGPPPGSSGSAYGYPNNYYGPSYAPPPTSSFGAYGPESPFSYSNSTGPPPLATPMAPHPHASALGSYQYPPQPALPSSGPLKRRLDEDTTNYIPVPQTNISSSGASASSLRKIPRISGPSLNMPIRALQEIPPPGQDDDQLWFPPTTERRSSLAISALLGSPVEDHKPRAPWGDASLAVGGGGGGAGGDMEEKAKALLGSAH